MLAASKVNTSVMFIKTIVKINDDHTLVLAASKVNHPSIYLYNNISKKGPPIFKNVFPILIKIEFENEPEYLNRISLNIINNVISSNIFKNFPLIDDITSFLWENHNKHISIIIVYISITNQLVIIIFISSFPFINLMQFFPTT